MKNPMDMNKISYNQSLSRDNVVLYVALRGYALMHPRVLGFEAEMQYDLLLG